METNPVQKILFNPFLLPREQPKLLDGKVARSAGIKLRSSGTLRCGAGNPTWICLFAGYSHVISFVSSEEVVNAPAMFQGHVENGENRAFIQSLRVVSTGLKLVLMNNSEEAEGIFEAVRIPVLESDFVYNAPDGGQLGPLNVMTAGDHDLSSHVSYTRGDLKDIDKYLFKLNSVNTEHNFQIRHGAVPEEWNRNAFHYDDTFDCILIKVTGRRVPADPSVLMYDSVSNQEIIYQENTNVSRLMTLSKRAEDFQDMLALSFIEKAGYLLEK